LNQTAPPIQYVDGTKVNGFFAQDVVSVVNITVESLKFELATETDDMGGSDVFIF
jgi:hypothetical protein